MVFNVHLIEMVGGNAHDNSSNNNNFENDDDKGSNASFADARNNSGSVIPNLNLNTCNKILVHRVIREVLPLLAVNSN